MARANLRWARTQTASELTLLQMMTRTQKILCGVGIAAFFGLLAVGLTLALAVMAVRQHQAVDRAGNEAATMQNLKSIAACEAQYFISHNRTFGTFDQLVAEQMLSSKFSGNPVTADGYVLVLVVTPKTAKLDSSFAISADPQNSSSGKQHFYLDSGTERIHVNSDRQAGPEDPVQ